MAYCIHVLRGFSILTLSSTFHRPRAIVSLINLPFRKSLFQRMGALNGIGAVVLMSGKKASFSGSHSALSREGSKGVSRRPGLTCIGGPTHQRLAWLEWRAEPGRNETRPGWCNAPVLAKTTISKRVFGFIVQYELVIKLACGEALEQKDRLVGHRRCRRRQQRASVSQRPLRWKADI